MIKVYTHITVRAIIVIVSIYVRTVCSVGNLITVARMYMNPHLYVHM